MISRPGACRRFVLVFWWRDLLLLWLSSILALVKRHLQNGGGWGLV